MRDFGEVHLVGTKTYVGADIKTPSGSATVSRTTSVKIVATGVPPGVPLVYRLAADGRQIGVVTSTTLEGAIDWNTPTVTNGAHLLEATVADRSGTVLATDVQTVTVANALAVFITSPNLSATVSGTVAVNVWLEGAASGSTTYTIAVDGKTIATQTCACVHVWPGGTRRCWRTARTRSRRRCEMRPAAPAPHASRCSRRTDVEVGRRARSIRDVIGWRGGVCGPGAGARRAVDSCRPSRPAATTDSASGEPIGRRPGNGTNHERDSGTSRIADQVGSARAKYKQGGKITL